MIMSFIVEMVPAKSVDPVKCEELMLYCDRSGQLLKFHTLDCYHPTNYNIKKEWIHFILSFLFGIFIYAHNALISLLHLSPYLLCQSTLISFSIIMLLFCFWIPSGLSLVDSKRGYSTDCFRQGFPVL